MVPGQARVRPLSATLAAALDAADAAGISRLADITWLDDIGVPVFQAIRPWSRSLSVAMGKGLSRRAAMVSALLEGIETDVAERLRPAHEPCALRDLGPETMALWNGLPRRPGAIRLDPDIGRPWVEGHEIKTGRQQMLPFDLVSMDYTRPAFADVRPTSCGLASGNSSDEALASALAEVLEHDLEAGWLDLSAREQRRSELDCGTVDDPLLRPVLEQISAAGHTVRLWNMGQPWAIAAFCCSISDHSGSETRLPPAAGTGCHPDRTIAALRAVLEAAQVRAGLVAGARDDLTPGDYERVTARTIELALGMMSFGPGPLRWSEVPTGDGGNPTEHLHRLLAVASARSPLPLLACALPKPHPDIDVVRILAPGLLDIDRAVERRPDPPPIRIETRPVRSRRRLIFVGPTLHDISLPGRLERRPSARVGDLAALLDDPPEAVGLIDGCFEATPSVWHKEILDLLASGVAVYGAASLGALRAAELHSFGMRGIGRIFEAYRDEEVHRDDAVMVRHVPEELGGAPETLALVDAEHLLSTLPLPAPERRMLQRIARTLPFRSRTWDSMLAAYAGRSGRRSSVDAVAIHALPSLKRRDALLLVETLQGAIEPMIAVERPPLSCFYRSLLRSRPATLAPPRSVPVADATDRGRTAYDPPMPAHPDRSEGSAAPR